MSSNSNSSNGSDKFNSESDGRIKGLSKLEHTGNKSEKTSGTNVHKKSLEEKITEALKSVPPDKRQAQKNPTIKVVPLNVKISKDNISYYKITTQEVENSILKTIVTHFRNNYEQQANEESCATLNKSFITCSKHLRLLLGALSPAYRPHLTARNHSQPVLRKISSQKELKKSAEHFKTRDSIARLPQSVSKNPFTKLIFGAITPSYATKQHQEPPNIKQKEQKEEKIVSEHALHKVPETKMATRNNNALMDSLPPYRQKLYKKQYKYARVMKPRNEKELKMREKLLKLLLHLKNTAEETENIIKAFCHHNDMEHLQEYFNTQLNKTTSSNYYQHEQKESIESLEHQNTAQLSAETKKLKEAKHQQKLDVNKEKRKNVNVLLSYNDRKHTDMSKDTQSQTFIRSAKEVSEHSKSVDETSTESKREVLNATRQVLPSKEQKPIKIILKKTENRKTTMKMWNDNDYIRNKILHKNNHPPIPIKEKEMEIQERKTAENTHALNETKSGSAGKALKEKKEHHPALGHAEHSNEKSDSEAHKINLIERICINKKSVWAHKSQVVKDKLMSSKLKSSEKENSLRSKKYNQSINTPQPALLEETNAVEKQNIKFKENKGQSDKEKKENATALKTQEEQKLTTKVSRSKMLSQKVLAVKRERLRLSRAIRQKGRIGTYCKPRVTSQKLPLIPVVGKANSTKSIKIIEHPESGRNETKVAGSLSNNSADKTNPKETETQLKGHSLSEKNEKPFSSNESNIDMSKSEKQKPELLKSKSTAVTETSTKIHSSKESNSNSKTEDLNSKQEDQNVLKSKTDINKKKIAIDRAAAKAELKEIELQRKQELQALKEKLIRPKSKFSKSDAYYEYLLRKLKVPHKKQKSINTKTFGVSTKKIRTSILNKLTKSRSAAPKHGTEREKLDKHKSKVLSQKEIDQYFKCSSSSDKSKSCSGPDLTPMPKYGCQHSHLTYDDLKSVLKIRTDTNCCQTLPQITNVCKSTHPKKSNDSKLTLKEDKCTPKEDKCTPKEDKCAPKEDKCTSVLKILTGKDAEDTNQKLNKKSNCMENKMPEVKCADEKINNESERKSKSKSNAKTTKIRESMQTENKRLKTDMLYCKPQIGCSDVSKKQNTPKSKTGLRSASERIKDLYSFTVTGSGRQTLKNGQNCKPRKSIKEMTIFKSSFTSGLKHKQQFQKSLQAKLKRMRGASKKNKAEELKAKQVIKKALLTNIHEAIRVKHLKEGFRKNFHWSILKNGIQNSFHGRQFLNAVKQSLKSLYAGSKGSVNTKELRLAFREGIKWRELLSILRQSINLPLLFRGLANATKEYTKLKYNTFKKIREESNKKNGGDNNGANTTPKQPPGEDCNKQRGDPKHQARAPNKSQMLYQLNNLYKQISAQPLLITDVRKLMTEILAAFPSLPLKTAEYLQLSPLHKYFSKHFTGLNTSVSYIESSPSHKSIHTKKELAPFALKSSDSVEGRAELNLACPNKNKTNVSGAVSKDVKFFQGFWRNHGPKIVVKGQTNNDICSKPNAIQKLNVMTKAIYEADRNTFTTGLNRRLALNQLLRDFFSPNEYSSTAKKIELNETVAEKSPEEALHKLIHDNMHTVNKACISENSVHNGNNTLKEKILLFFLKHDMIYVTEDMPKHLIPPISENISNKQKCISASIQEIPSSSHNDSDPKCHRGNAESLHSSGDKGSAEANITDAEETSKVEPGKAEAKPEHIRATKPEKLTVQHYSNETNLTGLAKYFNSETITGRANVAKATLACVALGYLYYRAKKRSKSKRDGKSSK